MGLWTRVRDGSFSLPCRWARDQAWASMSTWLSLVALTPPWEMQSTWRPSGECPGFLSRRAVTKQSSAAALSPALVPFSWCSPALLFFLHTRTHLGLWLQSPSWCQQTWAFAQFGEMGSGVMHTALWTRVYACLRIRVHVAMHVEAFVQVCPRVHVRISGVATPFRDWSVSILLEPRPPAPWGPLWATGALAASPGSCLNSAWWLALSTRVALWLEVPFPAALWLPEATAQV